MKTDFIGQLIPCIYALPSQAPLGKMISIFMKENILPIPVLCPATSYKLQRLDLNLKCLSHPHPFLGEFARQQQL
jgi:hypothetical protein